MKEINLPNWIEFEKVLQELDEFREKIRKDKDFKTSKPFFRGQGSSSWKLSTTLERYTGKNIYNVDDYFIKAEKIRPEIETFTKQRWEVHLRDFFRWAEEVDVLFPKPIPFIEYLIYLRHHGFPSPLLDWTRSPYVAAYFSFMNPPKGTEKVSIYAFIEWTEKGKTQKDDNPIISSSDINTASHKRHFVQQSEYTICLKKDGDRTKFVSHEAAFAETEEGESLLWKLTIPVDDRIQALKKLDQMNINEMSLFGTEESLMKTAALRIFDF